MIYDDFAMRVRGDYELFLMALRGEYLSLVMPGVEVTPRTVMDFHTRAKKQREAFMQTAKERATTFLQEHKSARSDMLYDDFMSNVYRATVQNMSYLVGRLKGSEVNPLRMEAHSAMGLLLQKQMTQPEFEIKTHTGRKYKAQHYLKAEARHFAYNVWLEGELAKIAESSDLAEVHYANSQHPNNGLVFSITGNAPDYPSLDSLRDSIFHFNAQAMVRHVSP